MIGFLWNLAQQDRIERLERRIAHLEGKRDRLKRRPAPPPPSAGRQLAGWLILAAVALLIVIASSVSD